MVTHQATTSSAIRMRNGVGTPRDALKTATATTISTPTTTGRLSDLTATPPRA